MDLYALNNFSSKFWQKNLTSISANEEILIEPSFASFLVYNEYICYAEAHSGTKVRPENTHRWGRITGQLVSSLTRLDLTKKGKVLFSTCSEAVESKLVKLETSHTVILPPTVSVLWLDHYTNRLRVIITSRVHHFYLVRAFVVVIQILISFCATFECFFLF